jgi:hypothetical protein
VKGEKEVKMEDEELDHIKSKQIAVDEEDDNLSRGM